MDVSFLQLACKLYLQLCSTFSQTVSLPFKEKTKDGQTYTEYREDDVQDSVFETVLSLAYKMFKVQLFMDSREQVCMQIHTHTYAHTHTHICMHYTCMHAHMHTNCKDTHQLMNDKRDDNTKYSMPVCTGRQIDGCLLKVPCY